MRGGAGESCRLRIVVERHVIMWRTVTFVRPLAVFLLLAAGLAVPSAAEAGDAGARIAGLERQVALLAQALGMPASANAKKDRIELAQYVDPADLSVRLGQLENQVRALTGRVEELSHQVAIIADQLSRGGAADIRPDTGATTPGPRADAGAGAAGDGQMLGALPGDVTGTPPVGGPAPGAPLDLSTLIQRNAGSGAPSPVRPGGPMQGEGAAQSPDEGGTVALSGSPEDMRALGIGYIERGDYVSAEKTFRDLLDKHPSEPISGSVQFWLGESLYGQGRYQEAADAYLNVYERYQTSDKVPDSLLKLGMTLAAIGQKDAACATWGKLESDYPDMASSLKERMKREQAKAKC